MQANWSLILNILLLTGVVVAIVRMLRMKKIAEAPMARVSSVQTAPAMGVEKPQDDVIAIRKISREVPVLQANFTAQSLQSKPVAPKAEVSAQISPSALNQEKRTTTPPQSVTIEPNKTQSAPISAPPIIEEQKTKETEAADTLMIFLLAKENRQLAGYELLQTILSAGLRFGEGHLFHRHQYPNGQGPVLCSLATATASGVFDLQNIGAFSVHGLCLFMQTSGNTAIDTERFSIMVDTAKQLSEGLDTHMLDDQRKSWSEASEMRYEKRLNIEE